MKLCLKCNQEKVIEYFRPNIAKPDGLQAYCISCDKEYQREWYKKNRKKHLAKQIIRNGAVRLRNQKFIFNYLSEHPCVDCGESDVIVLEFDHLRDKLFTIGRMYDQSLKRIRNEISKCDVRCCNCHRRKTAKQLNWYKALW